MRLPCIAALRPEHGVEIVLIAHVIDLAELRILLHQRHGPRARAHPVDRLRHRGHQVPGIRVARLLARDDQKRTVAEALRAREVRRLIAEPRRTHHGAVAVKIGQHHDVHSQRAEHADPGRLQVHGARVLQFLLEVQMKVAYRHLVAGHRLVLVVMRVGHHRRMCCRRILRAQIPVDRHALQRSRGRVVQRLVIAIAARAVRLPLPHRVGDTVRLVALLALRLPHPRRKAALAILSIPHVPLVQLDFARPEKAVRGREDRQRPRAGFQHRDPAARPQRHPIHICRAAELIPLPHPRDVLPAHARTFGEREPAQPRVVLVRHRGLRRLRDRLLAQQVRPAIHGEAQFAAEDARGQPGKCHFDARAVGAHTAAGGVILGPCPPDLFGLARQVQVAAERARNLQRRIPERVPLFALDQLRRERDSERLQRIDLLLREAPHAAGDLELRRQVARQHLAAYRQFPHYRTPVMNAEARPQRRSALALPRHFQRVAGHRRAQSLGRAVLRKVALQSLGRRRRSRSRTPVWFSLADSIYPAPYLPDRGHRSSRWPFPAALLSARDCLDGGRGAARAGNARRRPPDQSK